MEEILEIHEKALQIYLKHKEKNPEFTFATRVQNNKGRLDQGHWFQGSDYVFTSPYHLGDANTKTKTIGFVISKKSCSVEINFCDSRNQKKLAFYKDVLALLGIEFNSNNCRYQKRYDLSKWETELSNFLDITVPQINALINRYEYGEKFFFSEKDFERNLKKIMKAKDRLDYQKMKNYEEEFSDEPLNQILYGPPGTGKTFSTIRHALQILDPNADFNDAPESIKELKEAFPGQVEFVTFHQSFSYEDFVEGIQATSDGDNLSYSVEDGVFKNICTHALFSSYFKETSTQSRKIEFTELYDQFLEVVKAHLPYEVVTSSQKRITINSISERDTLKTYHEGSEVVHSVGRKRIKKLFDVFDTREKFDAVKNAQNEFRNVIGGLNSTVYWAILNKLLSFKDELESSGDESISSEDFTLDQKKKILRDSESLEYKSGKPHILIIDEINRGNISRIFGELITLIESSKRAGQDEEISVTLPYSKESFSVPDNLYIIGTMNTADRSLAMMDTALRRRFDFIEMMPNPWLLTENEKEPEDKNDLCLESLEEDIKVKEVNLRLLLTVMNQRIEALYDREHTLGHAFFMTLNNSSTIQDLANIFKNKVLPLLEEYFYDDWQKIRLVLGAPADYFYEKVKLDKSLFVTNDADFSLPDYRYNKLKLPEDPMIYQAIYDKSKLPKSNKDENHAGEVSE